MRRILVLILVLSTLLAGAAPVVRADDPVQRAIAWLHTQQLADGSFGNATWGSASVTADVVYVLALAGEDPGGPAWTKGGRSALDALAALTPDYIASGDAGQAGKVARAVAAAGRNPRNFGGTDVIGVIQQAYKPATGRYHPSLLFRHTIAVEALRRAGEPVPTAAVNALLAAQLPNGGWFWAFIEPGQIDPSKDQSDIDATGRVLQTLAGPLGLQCLAATYGRAAAYLAGGQLASGGWGVRASQTPENANSTGLVIAGLLASGRNPNVAPFRTVGQTATAALLSYQEPSGAFVYIKETGKDESRLMATADALVALLQPLTPAVTCRSTYLPLILR
jgi:hypothetical protein